MNLKNIFARFSRAFKQPASSTDNISYNKNLWNTYSKQWTKQKTWVEKQGIIDKETYLKFLGDEWGTKEDVQSIIDSFIKPHITAQSHVLEIGVGGGRIAHHIAPLVARLDATDISREMLKRSRIALAHHKNITYTLLSDSYLTAWQNNSLDFIYSFDVFVHLDLHTMWRYFQEIARVLKPGSTAFLHTTNLKAPAGWQRFIAQKKYRVEGHYFITPEIIQLFCTHSNLRIIQESTSDPTNFYYARDYLFVVKK